MQEEAEGVLTMTSTFQDYFNDLQVWIQSRYFFGLVVIDCLHNSVKRYFKSFSKSKNSFDDCMTLGCRIKTDYEVSLIIRFLTNSLLLATLQVIAFLTR